MMVSKYLSFTPLVACAEVSSPVSTNICAYPRFDESDKATGIFAQSWVSRLDGTSIASGGIDGNGIQVGKQFAEIAAISSYSFVVTCIILMVLKYIPGMHLRASEEAEMMGLDLDQFFDEQIGDWSAFEQNAYEGKIVGESSPNSGHGSVREISIDADQKA